MMSYSTSDALQWVGGMSRCVESRDYNMISQESPFNPVQTYSKSSQPHPELPNSTQAS